MESMQSFFDDYCKGEPVSSSLEKFVELNPTHEFSKFLLKICHSCYDKTIFAEVSLTFKTFVYQNHTEIEQLFYFWLLLEANYMNIIDYNSISIINYIKRLDVSKQPVEVQIIPIYIENTLTLIKGEVTKYLEASKNLLVKLKNTSPRYHSELYTYLQVLCYLNKHDEFNKLLNEYKTIVQDKNCHHKILRLEALYTLELADFEMLNLKAKELKNYIHLPYIKKDYDILKNICTTVNNKIPEEKISNVIDEYYALTIACLRNKKYQSALKYAHKAVEIEKEDLTLPHFFSYNILRAELANNNSNATLYSLQKRRSKNIISVYDDFFYFRIYHQNNERKLAQQYFNQFYHKVLLFDLHKRLEFEIGLSPELSATELMKYSLQYREPNLANTNYEKTEKNKELKSIGLKGISSSFINMKENIQKLINTKTPILIIGETGTGKELVAKTIHNLKHQTKPFIPINCASIPDHLLQSELFGHIKGAFTSANTDRQGIFDAAKDGTIFLDEIGDISTNMQVALLRLLESGEYRPLGSNEIKKINCQILMATNQNLNDLVKSGTFRKDLQYRLERIIIEIPPLRNREKDIPLLIDYFLNELNPDLPKISFDKECLDYLCKLNWGGNIRELKNEMERIRLFFSDKSILTIQELSEKYRDNILESIATQSDKDKTNKTPKQSLKSRREEEFKIIFKKYKELSKIEVINLLDISDNTANKYLKKFEEEGMIYKSRLEDNRRQYYELK